MIQGERCKYEARPSCCYYTDAQHKPCLITPQRSHAQHSEASYTRAPYERFRRHCTESADSWSADASISADVGHVTIRSRGKPPPRHATTAAASMQFCNSARSRLFGPARCSHVFMIVATCSRVFVATCSRYVTAYCVPLSRLFVLT